jgi:hypothetical protein
MQMPTIKFNFEQKPVIDGAYGEWRDQLPREQGQLGGTMTMTIEVPGRLSGRAAVIRIAR